MKKGKDTTQVVPKDRYPNEHAKYFFFGQEIDKIFTVLKRRARDNLKRAKKFVREGS